MRHISFLVMFILLFPSFCFSAEPSIGFPTSQDTDAWLTRAHNRWFEGTDHGKVTLNEALDDSETGVDVVSVPSTWNTSGGYYVVCEKEYMYVESIASTTLTVTRGVGGSSAAAHDSGKTVYYILTAESIEHIKDSIQAIQAELLAIPFEIAFTNGSWTCDSNDDGDCADANEVDWTAGAMYLAFDADTEEHAYSLLYRLPDDFDGAETVSLDIGWHAAATSGDVRWCFAVRSISGNSEAWTAWSTSECAADTVSGTASELNVLTDSTVVESWAGGYLIQVRLERDADNVADSMAGDAYIDFVTVKGSRTAK